MNYIAQADVENYLQTTLTTPQAATFTLLLPLMQELIDNYCNRSWNITNPIVENFDALSINGNQAAANYTFFPKYHVSSTPANGSYPLAGGIISATVGNSPLDLNYIVNYGTHIKFSASFPSVLLANPLGFKMVQITYNSDDAANVPPSVKMAFIQWMAREIQNAPDAGKEPFSVQTGTVRVQFGAQKLESLRVMPPLVKLALDAYRIPALDHF